MAWSWYRCYVRWRHGARRLPRRLVLAAACVPLLLALLVLFRLHAGPASAPLGQRKYERALALRELPPPLAPVPPVPPVAPPSGEKRQRPRGETAPRGEAGPRGERSKLPSAPLEVPAGVRPEVAALYQLPEFACLRSGEVLPRARVNDDYCDCADGTDEPGTAACADGVFFCAGRDIESSRVGDGVCDCCDGADEAGTRAPPVFRLPVETQRRLGRYQAPCPNTCR